MYCQKCGSIIKSTDKYCPKCGEKTWYDNLEYDKKNERLQQERDYRSVLENHTTDNRAAWYVFNCKRCLNGIWKGEELVHHLIWIGVHVTTLAIILIIVTSISNNFSLQNTEEGSTTEDAVISMMDEAPPEEDTVISTMDEAPPATIIPEIENGDYIVFGKYEQDNNLQNGEEPIEWKVLDVNGDKALLISRYILDCKKYNEKEEGRYQETFYWAACSLRTWLNDSFFEAAFNEDEKSCVLESHLTTEDNSWSGVEGGRDTDDRVFCLSLSEVRNFFPDKKTFENKYDEPIEICEEMIAEATPYAQTVNNGSLYVYSHSENKLDPEILRDKHGSKWWLRTPGYQRIYSCSVTALGIADERINDLVERDDIGVRPAIWISIEEYSKMKE